MLIEQESHDDELQSLLFVGSDMEMRDLATAVFAAVGNGSHMVDIGGVVLSFEVSDDAG